MGSVMTIDELKRLNLVDLLARAWNMSFKPECGSFVALSPLREESRPSFYVACAADGHWVYCDHSDGSSGSIIDLMMRKHRTRDFSQACEAARRLARELGVSAPPAPIAVADSAAPETDWEWLHRRLRSNDGGPCGTYLTGRGLDDELVNELMGQGVIVLNCIDGSRYCCFAVRDAGGGLRSLFNRRIDGPSEREKFVLGRQHPFCADWGRLAEADAVYLCESIIDALSVQTLCPQACTLAVPGANYDMSQLELPPGARLIDAFDADAAGRAAAERLRVAFPSRSIERFELLGAHDVNEFLQQRAWMSEPVRGTGKLTVRERIAIALSDRPSRELARKYGIHHSRVCDIRNEADTILASTWSDRRPGPKPEPALPEEQLEKEKELQEMRRRFELLTMRKEWLDLQLKIHEQRDAEVRRSERREKRKKKVRKKSR